MPADDFPSTRDLADAVGLVFDADPAAARYALVHVDLIDLGRQRSQDGVRSGAHVPVNGVLKQARERAEHGVAA